MDATTFLEVWLSLLESSPSAKASAAKIDDPRTELLEAAKTFNSDLEALQAIEQV